MGFKGAISILRVDCTFVPKAYADCTLVISGCTLLVCFKVISQYFFPAYWYTGIQCLAFKLLSKTAFV